METPLTARELKWAAYAFGTGVKTLEGVEKAYAALDARKPNPPTFPAEPFPGYKDLGVAV